MLEKFIEELRKRIEYLKEDEIINGHLTDYISIQNLNLIINDILNES